MITCETCGKSKNEDQFNPLHGNHCFGCRCKTVSLGFAGGKDYFHDSCDAERTRQAYADAAATGTKIIPATTVGANSLPSGQLGRLKKHFETAGA